VADRLKRGPTGVIGTNKSEATANATLRLQALSWPLITCFVSDLGLLFCHP
jgi:hypothetical protein